MAGKPKPGNPEGFICPVEGCGTLLQLCNWYWPNSPLTSTTKHDKREPAYLCPKAIGEQMHYYGYSFFPRDAIHGEITYWKKSELEYLIKLHEKIKYFRQSGISGEIE